MFDIHTQITTKAIELSVNEYINVYFIKRGPLFTMNNRMRRVAYFLKVSCITLRNETEWVDFDSGDESSEMIIRIL